MSMYYEDRIEKPEYFSISPLKRGRGQRTTAVIGFDSEADTTTGRPMLFQFAMPGQGIEDVWAVEVDERKRTHDPILKFMEFVAEHCTRKDTEYLIYGFNLEYEWTQLFGTLPEEVRRKKELLLLYEDRWKIEALNDVRYFAKATIGGTKRPVRILDAMAFYKTSLNGAAKMLNLGTKYDLAMDHGTFTREHLTDPEFLHYARQDAWITRRLGEHIVGMHQDFDVSTTVSAPHFASKVFKRKFLTDSIPLCEPEVEQYGLWSYHGGKNGFYIPEPTHLTPVYQYDITSAYPEAMRQLPDPTRATFVATDHYEPGVHAIWRAMFEYDPCKWRGFLNIDGTWPNPGFITEAFLTGYELDAMIARDEINLITADGFIMEGPRGGPLIDYVDLFFDMKRTTTGPERETAKLFLNSLYGKFFQKVLISDATSVDIETGKFLDIDPNALFDYRAGGLYHPGIASLITGFVRAKMHGIEHKYGSLMTSTDGIFGTIPPDPKDIGTDLGMLTVQQGDLKLWRERLYIFRPDDGSKPKVALHGFRGKPDLLDTIPLKHGTYTYEAQQVVTLKLSTQRFDGNTYAPGRFVTKKFDLTI